MTYTVQHKRSGDINRRPLPTELEEGQVALNYNDDSPGMFFKTSSGLLVKAGPATISATAPVASDLVNYQNFAVGEIWIDSVTNTVSYWDGLAWIPTGAFLNANGEYEGDWSPALDCTYTLGTPSNRWANIYTCDLVMSNEGSQNDVDGTWGSYVIQEGEEELFLINKRSGKKYKFMLEEVK